MKKHIAIFLSISIFITSIFISSNAFAEIKSVEKTQLEGTNCYYEFDLDKKTLTISGIGETPAYFDNATEQPWFEYREMYIDKVIVEEGITTLGDHFLYNVNAKSITLPNSLKKINSYALAFINNLEEINIPFGVTLIGSYAFQNDIGLKHIDLPDTLTSISRNAFMNCTNLIEISIPYSVQSIGSSAFKNCISLNNVVFQSLTAEISIGSSCFMNCPLLKSIAFPIYATLGTTAFGYNSSTQKNTGISMTVFSDSPAYNYATSSSNKIKTNIYNNIPVNCAVGYSNSFTTDDEEINYYQNSFTYSFTPSVTQKYNIYSRGNCDIDAVLSSNGITINSKKIDKEFNFELNEVLEEGKTYLITVTSNNSIGNYTLWIYPDAIESFDIYGDATDNAVKDMKKLNEQALQNLVLTINFSDKTNDNIYYKNDYFDGKYIMQNEKNITCTDTTASIKIGDITAEYPIKINHTYVGKDIEYTVDDDGYTLYSCILCKIEGYKDNYIKTPAIKIKGRIVFAEDNELNHPNNTPYPYISHINVNDTKSIVDRTYYVDENGYFTINTFNSISVEFINSTGGKNAKFSYIIDNSIEPYSVINYGDVAINGYDFNNDYKVNAKDYAIYLHEKKDSINNDNYLKYLKNFV